MPEISSKRKISFFSTISRIPTTLKYSPLFPVSEGGAVEIMPDILPMGVIVLGGIYPSNRRNCPQG